MPDSSTNQPPQDAIDLIDALLLSDCTDEQKACYLECAVATIGAIEDAISLLIARRVLPTLSGDERRLITVELADLEARRVKVRAHMYAFIAGRQAIKPPGKIDLDKVKALAKQLDELTADATMTRAVLDATAELMALYNRAVAS